MADVKDEAFASGVLGDGVAIEPTEGKLYAPADATVDNLFDTHHAIGLVTEGGAELLLHIGIGHRQTERGALYRPCEEWPEGQEGRPAHQL